METSQDKQEVKENTKSEKHSALMIFQVVSKALDDPIRS